MGVENVAEEKFIEWLEHKKYAYVYLEQSKETFSKLFRGIAKRPDFFVLIDSIGLIAVDVKDREIYKDYETFVVDDKKDVQKLEEFERIFKIPVWFAFSNEEVSYRTWYWISLNNVLKIEPKPNSIKGELFRDIPITNCKTLGWNDGLGKLFE